MAPSPTLKGCVVGFDPAVAGVGLGLAVPINAATRRIIGGLMSEGRFSPGLSRASAAVSRPLPPRLARQLGRGRCVEIVQVVDESPAAKAGLRPGDLIVAVDGEPVGGMTDLQRLMIGERIGAAVGFTVPETLNFSRSRSHPPNSRTESFDAALASAVVSPRQGTKHDDYLLAVESRGTRRHLSTRTWENVRSRSR